MPSQLRAYILLSVNSNPPSLWRMYIVLLCLLGCRQRNAIISAEKIKREEKRKAAASELAATAAAQYLSNKRYFGRGCFGTVGPVA